MYMYIPFDPENNKLKSMFSHKSEDLCQGPCVSPLYRVQLKDVTFCNKIKFSPLKLTDIIFTSVNNSYMYTWKNSGLKRLPCGTLIFKLVLCSEVGVKRFRKVITVFQTECQIYTAIVNLIAMFFLYLQVQVVLLLGPEIKLYSLNGCLLRKINFNGILSMRFCFFLLLNLKHEIFTYNNKE